VSAHGVESQAILFRVVRIRDALTRNEGERADLLLAAWERELGGLGLDPFPRLRSKPSKRKGGAPLPLCVGTTRLGEPCQRVATVGDFCRGCADLVRQATRICPECGRKPPGPLPASIAERAAASRSVDSFAAALVVA
jgi:hypothetical protein